MTDGRDVLACVLNGRELARISRPPPSARKRDLGVPAADCDLPLLHDCSTSGDDEYVGEVGRSTDRVGGDPNERPKLRHRCVFGEADRRVVLRHGAEPRAGGQATGHPRLPS
jgi:hypothetical protein